MIYTEFLFLGSLFTLLLLFLVNVKSFFGFSRMLLVPIQRYFDDILEIEATVFMLKIIWRGLREKFLLFWVSQVFPWKIGKSIIFGILNERIEEVREDGKTGILFWFSWDCSRLLNKIFRFFSSNPNEIKFYYFLSIVRFESLH